MPLVHLITLISNAHLMLGAHRAGHQLLSAILRWLGATDRFACGNRTVNRSSHVIGGVRRLRSKHQPGGWPSSNRPLHQPFVLLKLAIEMDSLF
jgi:hypothetical protein